MTKPTRYFLTAIVLAMAGLSYINYLAQKDTIQYTCNHLPNPQLDCYVY